MKKYLACNGADLDRVEVDRRGKNDPLVPTEPGVRERLNRRVVIEWQHEKLQRRASR